MKNNRHFYVESAQRINRKQVQIFWICFQTFKEVSTKYLGLRFIAVRTNRNALLRCFCRNYVAVYGIPRIHYLDSVARLLWQHIEAGERFFCDVTFRTAAIIWCCRCVLSSCMPHHSRFLMTQTLFCNRELKIIVDCDVWFDVILLKTVYLFWSNFGYFSISESQKYDEHKSKLTLFCCWRNVRRLWLKVGLSELQLRVLLKVKSFVTILFTNLFWSLVRKALCNLTEIWCGRTFGLFSLRFKMKVGVSLEDDRRRSKLIREQIGYEHQLVRKS